MRLNVIKFFALFMVRAAGCWVVACLGFYPLAANPAREGVVSVDAVKAAMVFNFVRFTDWPDAVAGSDSGYVIGVAGDRFVEDQLVRLAERQTIRDLRVRVVRVGNLRSLSDCHALYVGSAASLEEAAAPSVEELLGAVAGRPVLTIASSPRFLALGGIINVFVAEGGKLRFEIAPRHAEKAGLAPSSRLLALARIVDFAEDENVDEATSEAAASEGAARVAVPALAVPTN